MGHLAWILFTLLDLGHQISGKTQKNLEVKIPFEKKNIFSAEKNHQISADEINPLKDGSKDGPRLKINHQTINETEEELVEDHIPEANENTFIFGSKS